MLLVLALSTYLHVHRQLGEGFRLFKNFKVHVYI